jgi:hypothetical protein
MRIFLAREARRNLTADLVLAHYGGRFQMFVLNKLQADSQKQNNQFFFYQLVKKKLVRVLRLASKLLNRERQMKG